MAILNIRTAFLMALVGCILAVPVLAADDCATEMTAKANVESLDGDIGRMRDQRKAKDSAIEFQIDASAMALMKNGTWTEQDRSGFFAAQLKSAEFFALEKQKQSLLALFNSAARAMISHRVKGDFKRACVSANDMRQLLAKIVAINDKQFEKMLADIQAVSSPP